MVKSAENYAGPKNTSLSAIKQKSQSCLPKKWEQQKLKNPKTQQNARYRYTKRQSASKPVQQFTINSTVTTTQTSKRNICNDSSKKTDFISTKKVTNLSVNAICGPLSYIFPNGSLSQSKEMNLSRKPCESSRSSIHSKNSKTNSIQQSAMCIPSKSKATPQPTSIAAAPASNTTSRYIYSRKKNQMVKLMSDRIIYNLAKYEEIRNHVNKAIQNRKVFSILGRCKAIRDALRERGWVEKLRYRQFDNLKREIPYGDTNPELDAKKRLVITNNLLLRCNPNFYWKISANDTIWPNNSNPITYPLINRIKMDDKVFTTKAGLCSALKFQQWYHITGVSDVNSPRSYNVFDELEDFRDDYRITSCTNLLKWFIRNKDSEDPIMSEKGKIPFSVIFFALKRCQGFIQRKQHKDIDKIIKEPNPSDWDTFIDSYFKLIFRRQRLKVEHKNVMDFYIICANEMLRFMRKYKPEIDCEGMNNIWIIKPGALSRGRGITLSNDYKTIINISTQPRVQKYVVQKYIENPLLIYGTKFDIRQYYVITNTHPLVIWMYKNCYLRFSSQKYTLRDFHESIHLTNNAIQHKYKSNANRDPKLPNNNMWVLQQFKDYLDEEGQGQVWNKIIYQGMKRNIIGAMLTCQEGMIHRINQFELYGCDFILDNKFKPWLIEINSSPDMSCSTKVTAKLCPQVLEDIIKVVVDYRNDRQAPTGDFECIYRQKITQPIYSTDISSLVVYGVDGNNRNSRSRNKSIGDQSLQYDEACTEECLKTKQSWKNHLIKLESEEDLLKNEIMKLTNNEELLSSSTEKVDCENINQTNNKSNQVIKEEPNSTNDYSEKLMPKEKKDEVVADVISDNRTVSPKNFQHKSNPLSQGKNHCEVEMQKKISPTKGTTGKKHPTERSPSQISRKNAKKIENKFNSAENNKKGLSCTREIHAKPVQSVKMKKNAPLTKKDLTKSRVPIRKPVVQLDVAVNTQETIKEHIENSGEPSEVFNSEKPKDALNSQMTPEDETENLKEPLDVVNNTQPQIEEIFHSEKTFDDLNTQELANDDQNIYSEEQLDAVKTRKLVIEEQIVNLETSEEILNTQQLPIEGQTAYSEELLDVVNTSQSPIITEIFENSEEPLNVVTVQLPIIGDQITNSEGPVNTQLSIEEQIIINAKISADVLNTKQLPIEGLPAFSEELLDVINTQLSIVMIENPEEKLDVVYTQVPIIEEYNENSEESLNTVNTQLPIIEEYNENSEEILNAVNAQLPIMEEYNENSEEILNAVNTQLLIIEEYNENSEEPLNATNTQLPIIEEYIENSEELLNAVNTQLPIIQDKNKSLNNRKKSLPITENNNQLKTSENIQGRTNHPKKKIGRIGENTKIDIKKSLSQHGFRRIHSNHSAKRQQLYEKINAKKIVKMFMKKKKCLLDSIIKFYQEDLNKSGNQIKPFILSTKKPK